MRIIGTAGHVDHGKSTLVKTLTGIDPDRLKEEKERQMTIDLGFAWMKLGDNLEVGFIDVPGHIDFIENMLMGVGAIDAAMLVIAADEGVMPQTQEHLDILKLLDVQNLIVALTKSDLVDNEWSDLVIQDIEDFLLSRGYDSPLIIPVSSATGQGVEEIRSALHSALINTSERDDFERPRLFVDRVFSLPGFGTIVTGTLIDGTFITGQKVQVLPGGGDARIRGLQSFHETKDASGPGNRLAVNLSGISVNDIDRGMVIASPETYKPSNRITVRFSAIKSLKKPVLHNLEVKLYHGSTQANARIRLLGADQINPGEVGLLQLELSQPIVARFGDRYILRRPSPSQTIGGGEILEPHPLKRYRRFDQDLIHSLDTFKPSLAVNIVEHLIKQHGLLALNELKLLAGLDSARLDRAMCELLSVSRIARTGEHTDQPTVNDGFVIHTPFLDKTIANLIAAVTRFHIQNPYLRGMPLDMLRSQMGLSQEVFSFILGKAQDNSELSQMENLIAVGSFSVQLTEKDQKKVREAMEAIRSNPLQTPSPAEISNQFGSNILAYLKDQDMVIQVSDQVLFEKGQFEEMVDILTDGLRSRGSMKVTEIKELIPASRKYILAFLEYLDRRGITQRNEDVRTLRKA